jgi:hypothetical protein
MAQNKNDDLWDPRPRLRQEADHVNGGEDEASTHDPNDPMVDDTGTVLVELAPSEGMSATSALQVAHDLQDSGFEVDDEFGAIPMGGGTDPQTFIVRGRARDQGVIERLTGDSRVSKVWRDTPIAPFEATAR